MKKPNPLLISIICLFIITALVGVVVYASDKQSGEDRLNSRTDGENPGNSSSSASAAGDADRVNPDDSPTTPSSSASAPTAVSTPSADAAADHPTSAPTPTEATEGPVILGFAGDVNLDEDSRPVAKYDAEGKGILGVLSGDLAEEMQNADIMMLNNEFAYSTRGTEETDKSYTFRADPSRVGILKEMGVDIVSLANNHALDFGQEALIDTFGTLEDAGIDYVGAGENLDRAKAPIYKRAGDKTIAFVAASHVIFAMDWYADDNTPGMIGTYDPALFVESIKEAKANSDYVVAFVHWGVERNTKPEKYQRNLAKIYIDNGADLVIGCHPHVMQGFEFYKGKPIAYSLGNYWFNNSSAKSGMLKLYLESDGTVRTQLLPVMNKNTKTYLLTEDKDRSNYFKYMQGLSYDVRIDDEGFITAATEQSGNNTAAR